MFPPRFLLIGRRAVIAGLLLFAAAVLLYLPTFTYPYNAVDDRMLVEQNPLTRGGPAWRNLAESFFSGHEGYWIPLTWLSFLGEQTLAGNSPGLFHATNVVLHAGNAVLLMLLLALTTGRLLPAALAAGLFAVHPAHVESVAWIAARKDVLSTFLGLCALHAYLGWARRPRAGLAIGALAVFFLSLLAKPMLVAFPLLLLLLDFWPLGRFRTEPRAALIVEKLPFAAVAAAMGALYLMTQRESVSTLEAVSLGARLAYGLVSPLFYLGLLAWPTGLAFAYPIRAQPYPLWLVLAAPCLVAAAIWWAVRERLRLPWAPVGWLWYLAVLAPVAGFVQSGLTIVMDRILYAPAIGIYLLVAASLAAALPVGAWRRRSAVVAVWTVVVTALAAAGARQIAYWRDDVTLLTRTIAVAPDSSIGHWNLAATLVGLGEKERALEHAMIARRLVPADGEMAYNLGMVYDSLGRYDEAVGEFREALTLGYKSAPVQGALGVALGSLGRHEEGRAHLAEARRLDPRSRDHAYNLGVTLLRLERPAEAVEHLTAAAAIAPADHRSRYNLGVALLQAGRPAEAAARFVEVVRLDPGLAAAHRQLGLAREALGDRAAAATSFRSALALDPNDAVASEGLARSAAARTGR